MQESAFHRAWRDTERFRQTPVSFYALEIAGAAALALFGGFVGFRLTPENASSSEQWLFPSIGGLVGVIGGLFVVFLLVFMWSLFRAPYRQRDEAGRRVVELERKRASCIEVRPVTGKAASYEKNKNTAWAELEVRNSSPDVSLEDVNVQIVELALVPEKQDEPGLYFLYEPYPAWSTSNVYWSERNAPASQLSLTVPPEAKRYALVAFHSQCGSALGVLNTPTYPPMLESRIVVELSSPNSQMHSSAYYIAYHPPSKDEFEFVEWDVWRKCHNVIEEHSIRGTGDSQT